MITFIPYQFQKHLIISDWAGFGQSLTLKHPLKVTEE